MIAALQKLTNVAWDDVSLRHLGPADVDMMMDYVYGRLRPLDPFLQIDPSKLSPESEYRAGVEQHAANPNTSRIVMIDYKGRTLGWHSVGRSEDPAYADFHAHFVDMDSCGKGIGAVSWYKSVDLFFKRFNFERIYFKPPVANPYSANWVKKLPVRYINDVVLDYPFLIPNTTAHVFEITREEFEALK